MSSNNHETDKFKKFMHKVKIPNQYLTRYTSFTTTKDVMENIINILFIYSKRFNYTFRICHNNKIKIYFKDDRNTTLRITSLLSPIVPDFEESKNKPLNFSDSDTHFAHYFNVACAGIVNNENTRFHKTERIVECKRFTKGDTVLFNEFYEFLLQKLGNLVIRDTTYPIGHVRNAK